MKLKINKYNANQQQNICKRLLLLLVVAFCLNGKAQVITKICGGNAIGYGGDNGLAINASIHNPQSLVCDASGNLYFVDAGNSRIRKIDTSGIITTFAGTGIAGYSGDNSLAINANINSPTALAFDKLGNLYFADNLNNPYQRECIRKINTQGIITAFAGDTSGSGFNTTDGIPAIQAYFNVISSIKIDRLGNVFVGGNDMVKKINSLGIIKTIAGGENNQLSNCQMGQNKGDGDSATYAGFNSLTGISVDSKGNIFICDHHNFRIRRVDAASQIITTYAGSCAQNSYGAFNGPVSAAIFNWANDMIHDSLDNLWFCDLGHVYKIDTLGVLTRIAGQGPGMAGGEDGGPALTQIVGTDYMAIDKYNHIYVSAGADNVIKKITLCTSVIPTINISTIANTTFCTGDSAKLVATGAPHFVWEPWDASSKDTLIDSPLSTIQYTAFGYSSNGCVGQDTFSIHVLNDCVWPGDANEDLSVDNTDLMSIGLKYGMTGYPRNTISNNWKGYACNNWSDTLVNGKNLKFADCNGDNIIDLDDTLSISLNYSLSHNARLNNQNEEIYSGNPDIYLQYNKMQYFPGDTVTADIYIGNSINSQNNFYGTTFDITYNHAQVVSGTEKLSFNNSWVGDINNTAIKLSKIFSSLGTIHAALVRTTHTDTFGLGKIAILHFVLSNTITVNKINLNISNSNKINSSGIGSVLTAGTFSVAIAHIADINQLSGNYNQVIVYPNPAGSVLQIAVNGNQLTEAKIFDVLGKEVLTTKETEIDLSKIPDGVYFVQVKTNKGISTQKVIVQK